MHSLNIVVISRGIHPILAPRALRATELAKEFAKQGHNVILYGVLGKYDYLDFEKKYNVTIKDLKRSIFTKIDSDGNIPLPLWKKGVIFLLQRWTLFPEILLIRRVKKALRDELNINLLVTIAVPYPIHWGAALARTKFKEQLKNTVWVSDCGDPFMGSPFGQPPFYFKYIEKWWCRNTDYITVPVKEAIDGYYPEFRNKIEVIPQGFDFSSVQLSDYKKNVVPTFAYSGMVYPKRRDPSLFLEYLCSLKDVSFKFIVYTNKKELFSPFVERLNHKIEIREYVPHEDLLKELSKMDFLINIRNESSVQTPSKLIDYYLSKRPILEITSSFKEENIFEQFIKGNYSNQLVYSDINNFNITNIAHRFINLYTLNK